MWPSTYVSPADDFGGTSQAVLKQMETKRCYALSPLLAVDLLIQVLPATDTRGQGALLSVQVCKRNAAGTA